VADTGAILPGLGSTEERTDVTAANHWTGPRNIEAEANYAEKGAHKDRPSHWLRASDFGFSISSDATIDGIKAEIHRAHGADSESDAADSALYLVNADGNNVGDNYASAVAWPYPDPETAVYGGSNDKWNASPTPSMINDSDFGIRLSMNRERGHVYWIKITVYYTEAGVSHQASAFFPFM